MTFSQLVLPCLTCNLQASLDDILTTLNLYIFEWFQITSNNASKVTFIMWAAETCAFLKIELLLCTINVTVCMIETRLKEESSMKWMNQSQLVTITAPFSLSHTFFSAPLETVHFSGCPNYTNLHACCTINYTIPTSWVHMSPQQTIQLQPADA